MVMRLEKEIIIFLDDLGTMLNGEFYHDLYTAGRMNHKLNFGDLLPWVLCFIGQ